MGKAAVEVSAWGLCEAVIVAGFLPRAQRAISTSPAYPGPVVEMAPASVILRIKMSRLVTVGLQTGEPALSFDFSVGDQVAAVGRRVWEGFRTPKGLEVFGPRHFGLDLDYVPLEDKVREFGL